MTVDDLIEAYLSVKEDILTRRKTVAELTPEQRAGLMLRLAGGDVSVAIGNARMVVEQSGATTSYATVETVRWSKAILIMEELRFN